jgi:hypothetical protein
LLIAVLPICHFGQGEGHLSKTTNGTVVAQFGLG